MAGFLNTPVSIELCGAEIVPWVPGANVAAVCGGDNTARCVKYDANFQNPEVVPESRAQKGLRSGDFAHVLSTPAPKQ